MERREFVKKSAIAGLSCLGIGLLLESCKTAFYAPSITDKNRIVVKKQDYGQYNFVLLKNDRFSTPIYLTKIDDNAYSAVLMLCTHKACELNAVSNYLVCPCHGSEFSNTGKVTHSPAEIDLQNFLTTSDSENIYIHL
jgi:cytochrome b6-f complex iron-sulfur subunit